jgi:adenosylcobinamide kinase/adenosylcobinamide-phosphate guanylyltransferase
VLGGAASGKSAFAEALVSATGRNRLYIATAQAFDAEMTAKIAAHRAARGPGWRTVEAPLDPAPVLRAASAQEVVLLDCATLWLSNLILAEADLAAAETALIDALAACAAPVVVVSNEVGQGLVPDTALGRRFRAAQGALNQRLAARADLAVLVVAGLPLVLKGTLP